MMSRNLSENLPGTQVSSTELKNHGWPQKNLEFPDKCTRKWRRRREGDLVKMENSFDMARN
jgi:hypothetical protein